MPALQLLANTEHPPLPLDAILATDRQEFVVGELLGQGGFGSVYKVISAKDPTKEYAMKLEYNCNDPKKMILVRLKIEIAVFEDIERAKKNSPKIDMSHFVKLIDKGCTPDFKYLVMDLVSISVRKLHNDILKHKTPKEGILYLAHQTLHAIESLHKIGYLHRDIKPSNFAVGLPPHETAVYLIDFGMCRKYIKPDGTHRDARNNVQFLGSLKFAPLSAHHGQDQSTSDDLEMWIYMIMEFFHESNLPWWTDRTNRNNFLAVTQTKGTLWYHMVELFESGQLRVPRRFLDIMKMKAGYKYESVIDYDKIHELLRALEREEELKMSTPMCWVGRIASFVRHEKEAKAKAAAEAELLKLAAQADGKKKEEEKPPKEDKPKPAQSEGKKKKKAEESPIKEEKRLMNLSIRTEADPEETAKKQDKLEDAIMKAYAAYGEPKTRKRVKALIAKEREMETESVESETLKKTIKGKKGDDGVDVDPKEAKIPTTTEELDESKSQTGIEQPESKKKNKRKLIPARF